MCDCRKDWEAVIRVSRQAQLDPTGKDIVINQLWDIDFGGGTANDGRTNQLFFTSGPFNNLAGTFGVIDGMRSQGPEAARPTFCTKDNWSMSVHCTLTKTQISKDKSVARNDFSRLDRQIPLKHGARIDKRMEFPVLAAGINACRQIRQELLIEFPTREFRG